MNVFLSYSEADRDVAREVASHLEQAGHEVWDPAEALFPGDNWPLRIGKALQESEAMVVLLSPQAMKSEWVRQEIEYALGNPQYKGRLIPVMVKPTTDIPWILKRFPVVRLGKRWKSGTIEDLKEAAREIAEYIDHGFTLAPAKT